MITLQRIGVNSVRYFYTEIDEKIAVEQSLTLKMKGANFSNLVTEGKWDGNVKYYNKLNETFAYGLIARLTNKLEKKKIEYKFLNSKKYRFTPTLALNSKLHEHQIEAVNRFFEELFGIIVVPTRGGKTFIASETIRHFLHADENLSCLFIVDTEDLFIQATNELKKYLGVEIGAIKGSEFNIKNITVASIQTLQSIIDGVSRIKIAGKSLEQYKEEKRLANVRKRQLLKFIELVKYLIVDECHEYSSSKRISILNKFKNADKKLFLSASPYKSESIIANYNLNKISGKEIYRITEQVLKEKGILARDKIVLIYINHHKNKNINVTNESASGYKTYLKEVITHNFVRNMVLINVIEICRKLMLKVLVLFLFKEHGFYFQSITGDPFLNGDNNIKERTEGKDKFLLKKGGVMLASDIWKKGITLPEVEVFVNAGGGLERANVTQKKGRVLGTTETKKKSLIIDIIDNYKYFKDHSLNRIKEYESSVLDKDDIIVLDIQDNDFYNDFRNFVEDWFER